MENQNEIKLDLITVTDPSVLRAIKHTRTQNYSAEALEKDAKRDVPRGLKDSKLCIFNIGDKVFNADINDPISKIILDNRQDELYSISFTKGEEYKDAKGKEHQGINFSSFLTKKQREDDIKFEQDLIIAQSRGELHVLEQKARIRKDYFVDSNLELADLESLLKGKG